MEAGTASAPQPFSLGSYGIAGFLAVLSVFAGIVGLAILGAGGACSGGSGFDGFTAAGRKEIPARYQAIYAAAGRRFQIPPAYLAAIGLRESNHGTHPATNEVNYAGCVGPMQLGVGGACGDFFGTYKVDGNADGRLDPRDPWDAVFTAANGLREGKGLPPAGEARVEDYFQSACGYYGACADYGPAILATAERYGGEDWWRPASLAGSIGSACAPAAGVGEVEIAPGANRPGVPLQPVTLEFLRRVAAYAGRKMVVTTGSNHSRLTSSGYVSMHWTGHGADMAIQVNGGARGLTRIQYGCLLAGGVAPRRAAQMARQGGLVNLTHAGLSIECIWRTADHFDHQHTGARPSG